MYIVKENQSDMKIVVSTCASLPVRHAARELQHFIARITGAELAIINDNQPKYSREIFVGSSNRTCGSGIPAQETLGKEELLILTLGEDLLLAGGEPRGTLYAVYEFLETVCGCRWYANECSYIPKSDVIEISNTLEIHKKPIFEYREVFYNDSFNGEFAVKNRLNGDHMSLKEEHGGKVVYAPGYFVHSFSKLVPPSIYYDEHPEYYALRDGVRQREGEISQLCLSNPNVLKIATEKALEVLRTTSNVSILSISQNDGTLPCTCPECSAIVEKEGSESGPILHFVNSIAQKVACEFPDVAIDTLAYDYSRKPPKHVRPLPNVIIRLCSFECCFAHPLSECREIADTKKVGTPEIFADFAGDVEKWAKIADRLYIWDYVTDFEFYHNIHPNFQVLSKNLKFFANNNVRGVFSQGNGQAPNGELAELRAWLLAKLSWDLDFDVDKGIDEFLAAWFGPAGGPIREYIDIAREALLKSGYHLSLYDTPTASFITKEFLDNIDAIFDRAEELTKELPVEHRRVLKERVGIKMTKFFHYPPDANRAKEVEKFISEAKSVGVTIFSEKWGMENIRRLTNRGIWPPAPEDMTVIRD